jgi:hypothetical protein
VCEFNRIAFIAESKSTVCSKYSIALCRFNYQIFNSHTAVFDCFLRGAGNITEAPPVADEARRCFERAERLAKQDARARTRSSSGAFARECAEQLIESLELSTAARRSRGLGVQPIKRQAHIGFAQQNCSHLKVLDF